MRGEIAARSTPHFGALLNGDSQRLLQSTRPSGTAYDAAFTSAAYKALPVDDAILQMRRVHRRAAYRPDAENVCRSEWSARDLSKEKFKARTVCPMRRVHRDELSIARPVSAPGLRGCESSGQAIAMPDRRNVGLRKRVLGG